MAKLYWTGKISSSVTNPQNWTLWGPNTGVTLPAESSTHPQNFDDVVFTKYSTYPIYSPKGFLSGVSGGTLASQLSTLIVEENFPINIGDSSNYFKFYAKNVTLNRNNGHTGEYIDFVSDPAGICGSIGNAYVSIKSKNDGINYYFKGNVWKIEIPQLKYNTFAKIYAQNTNAYFSCLNRLSADTFYFTATTTQPPLIVGGVNVTAESAFQYFYGSPTINIEPGYNNAGILCLDGENLVCNLLVAGVSGSDPSDTEATSFNKLNIGVFGGGIVSTSNTLNVNHEVFLNSLTIKNGTINFNDTNSVSVINGGEFYTDSSIINMNQPDNLEIAALTLINTNGSAVNQIKTMGSVDITLYANSPLT